MKAAIKALKKSALSKSGSKSIIDFSVAEMRQTLVIMGLNISTENQILNQNFQKMLKTIYDKINEQKGQN